MLRNSYGQIKIKIEYLIDSNNNNSKAYKDEEKELLYRNICQKIFEIPPNQNRHFDLANENRVKEFLEQNREIITPHQYTNLSRFDDDNILIKPIRASDVINVIKVPKMKHQVSATSIN